MLESFLNENKKNRQSVHERFMRANKRVMRHTPLEIEYDPTDDYLTMRAGHDGEPIVVFTTVEGLVVVADAKTYELMGVDCDAFMQKAKQGAFQDTALAEVVSWIEQGHHFIFVPAEDGTSNVRKTLGHLVPA